MRRIITEPVRIQTKDGTIYGYYLPSGKVKILPKSFFRNIDVNSTRSNIKAIRSMLINSNYVRGNELIKEYTFDNPSVAISVMLGRMESGNREFITIDNIELGSYLEVDSVVGFEQKEELYRNRIYLEKDDYEGVISSLDVDSNLVLEPDYQPTPKAGKIDSETHKFKRNEQLAKNALARAQYKCSIDSNHSSFETKNGNQYMEAHHLIPLSKQDDFEYSLDVDANVVCLCPNCHKKLHYGKDVEDMLKALYEDRKDKLLSSGIEINFEDLLELYR